MTVHVDTPVLSVDSAKAERERKPRTARPRPEPVRVAHQAGEQLQRQPGVLLEPVGVGGLRPGARPGRPRGGEASSPRGCWPPGRRNPRSSRGHRTPAGPGRRRAAASPGALPGPRARPIEDRGGRVHVGEVERAARAEEVADHLSPARQVRMPGDRAPGGEDEVESSFPFRGLWRVPHVREREADVACSAPRCQ